MSRGDEDPASPLDPEAAPASSPAPRPAPDVARGLVWSFLAAFFAAAYLIPFRLAVGLASEVTTTTAMFVAAGAFNLVVAVVENRGRLRLHRVELQTAVFLALLAALGNLGIARALPQIGAGMVSVVMKAQVLLTPILALWLLRESAPRRLWAGAVLALLGVALPQILRLDGGRGLAGYGFALLGAAAFAAMQVETTRVIHRIQPATVNALRLGLAVLGLQLFADGRAAWSAPADVWLYASLAGVLGPGVSRLYQMVAVRHLSPSVVALVALVGPVFAFGLGYLTFGEVPALPDLLGAVLVLLGVGWPLAPALEGRSWGFTRPRGRSTKGA